MSNTAVGSSGRLSSRTPPGPEAERRPFAPIKFFAVLGAFWVALAAVTLLRWTTSDSFKATSTGPDQISTGREVFLIILQAASTVAVVGLLLKFTILPLLRRERIKFDGMFLPAMLVTYLLDPTANYFNYTFLYNSELFNRGSWGPLIPGFTAPNQELLPEPLLFLSGMYVWGNFLAAVIGCWFLRRLRARFPRLGTASCLGITYVAFCAAIFIFEGIFIIRIAEIYSVAGPHEITLWPGERYQYPLHEMAFYGTTCLAMTSLRFFTDDKGRTVAERGVQHLRVGEKGKDLARLLAVIGAGVTGIFLAYFVPYQVFSMNTDTFPRVPSYLNAICGPGTDYACPSEQVPVPTRNSISITPSDPRLSPAG